LAGNTKPWIALGNTRGADVIELRSIVPQPGELPLNPSPVNDIGA
jgi:hypothetical protein